MPRAFDDEDAATRKVRLLIQTLEFFDAEVAAYAKEGIAITGFSVRCPEHEGLDYFMVVRASTEGQKMVAFRDGEDLVALLRGFLRALKARNLKWRQDEYE